MKIKEEKMAGLNGKCKFQLEFIERTAVVISGSVRGVLGVILFDTTNEAFTKKEYYSAIEVKEDDGQLKTLMH